MRRWFAISLSLFSFIACSVLNGIPSFAEGVSSIQIKGSDTMVNLGQAWAEAFLEENPTAFIAVTGGGSGTGIAALINGTCDIAQSSREISKKESELAGQKGRNVTDVIAALDAVAFVVHSDNPVTEMKIDQLSDIFTGKTRNWKELGGQDAEILVLSRERNSGTHIYILEEVVRKGNKKGRKFCERLPKPARLVCMRKLKKAPAY